MRAVDVWTGTIQGPNGVFNDRLTDGDVAFIKNRLRRIPRPEIEAARAAGAETIVVADVLHWFGQLEPQRNAPTLIEPEFHDASRAAPPFESLHPHD
jgi:hypothetical protein